MNLERINALRRLRFDDLIERAVELGMIERGWGTNVLRARWPTRDALRLSIIDAEISRELEAQECPTIIDAKQRPLELGDRIDGGDGVIGEIVRFPNLDERGWGVAVRWPGADEPETFSTSPRDYRLEGPALENCRLQCSEIERLP